MVNYSWDKENPADGSNWQLLCRSCNVKKGLHHKPRKKRTASKFNKFKRVRKSLIPITPYTDKFYFTTAQMQKNKDAELPCREFMIRIINSLGTVPKQDLLNATANEYTKTTEAEGNAKTISQDTLANYLAKLTNKINGEYEEGLLDDHAVIRKRDRNPQ